MSEHDVRIGALLAGKYRVERVLGSGGMGVVVEATQLDLDRRVALKFLRKSALPDNSAALTRFEREARAVARLRGAHVVQVFDVGRLEHNEPFIVMELLNGEDLSAVLERAGRVPVATALDYVLQACEAMAEAHVAGVIHRDLKPANLFVSRRADGRPLIKVLDFGIAKLVSETASLSLTNGVLGSPLYMSPEQLGSAKDIDHRTDIWSLGAILYELLTGSPAFGAGDLPQVCARIAIGTPDPIRSAEVPPELESVILTCLNKRPSERYPSIADLALALMPFARRSSRDAAEAAIRIVQSSTLPHGPLPQAFDSLKPPAFDATQSSPELDAEGPRTVVDAGQGITADSVHDRTVNISAKPPSATQGELKPLVFPATLHALAPQEAPRKRPLLWAGLAVAAVALLVAGTRLVQRAEPASTPLSAEPAASSIPAAPTVSPNHAPPPRASAQRPIEPLVTPATETTAPAAARASAPPPIKRPRAPARKSQPDPKSAAEPSPEDLLNHR